MNNDDLMDEEQPQPADLMMMMNHDELIDEEQPRPADLMMMIMM